MASTSIIETILSPALAKLNIGSYTLETNYGKSKGESYASDAFKVKVKHQNGEINLFLKLAVTDDQQRDFMEMVILYRNEVSFYTIVFPVFDQFQREKCVKVPFEVTKCYATSTKPKEEILVLEDIGTSGYRLCDRRKTFDETHIALVLRNYGKLHAISLALRHQRPKVFQEITESLTNAYVSVFPKLTKSFKMMISKNVEMLERQGLKSEAELSKQLMEDLDKILVIECDSSDPYRVVVHGDCWSNNMMFKYDVSLHLVLFIDISMVFISGKYWKTSKSTFH